jgi:2'-5' RNA ligase
MRLFVAVCFNQDILEALTHIQAQFKQLSITGNYTKKENLHLTIKFLGEVEKSQQERISAAFHEMSQEISSFTISMGDLGCFKRRQASLLWLKMNNHQGKLDQAFKMAKESLDQIGFPKEDKPFKPHVTLIRDARFNEAPLALNEIKEKIAFEKMTQIVNRLVLMESTREQGQLIYKPIESYTFKSSNI